jgi:hypothetical protein
VIAECGDRPGAVEDYPFGDDVAVFKVVGTMFALVPLLGQPPGSISLKCDPDLAVGLRARYLAITAGYHLNKRHSARAEEHRGHQGATDRLGGPPTETFLSGTRHLAEAVPTMPARPRSGPPWGSAGPGGQPVTTPRSI